MIYVMDLKIMGFLPVYMFGMMLHMAKGQQSVDYNVTTLKQEIDTLMAEAEYQSNVMKSMYNDMQAVQSQMQAVQSLMQAAQSQMQVELSTLKAKQNSLQDAVDKARTVVAFTAYMQGGTHHPSGESSKIPFSGVNLNIGGGYNKYTSAFRCPHNGVYFFSVSLYSYQIDGYRDYHRTAAHIMRGSSIYVAGVYCHNHGNSTIEVQCATSVLEVCNAGIEVWVKAGHDENQMWGSDSNMLSLFTGFLVHKY